MQDVIYRLPRVCIRFVSEYLERFFLAASKNPLEAGQAILLLPGSCGSVGRASDSHGGGGREFESRPHRGESRELEILRRRRQQQRRKTMISIG